VPTVTPQAQARRKGTARFMPKKGIPEGPPGPWVLLAAWGPCGYAPFAPGTVGTLGAIPLFLALRRLPPGTYLLAAAAFTALACLAAAKASPYWKASDASPIVIDEVAGYLVTMALAPPSWGSIIAGFLLFRLFDVVKPWPASFFDRRVKNGFGVVMDDVAAGVWALAALAALQYLFPVGFGCSGSHFWCLS